MKLSDRKIKSYVTLGVLALVCVVLLLFTVSNVLSIPVKQAEAGTEAQLLSANQTKLAQLEEARDRAEEVSEQVALYSSMLPESLSQSDVLANLYALSEQYQVSIQQVTFQEATQAVDGVQKLPVQLTVSGPYLSVMQMLEYSVTSSPMATLDELTLAANAEEGSDSISAQTVLSVYYQG